MCLPFHNMFVFVCRCVGVFALLEKIICVAFGRERESVVFARERESD